MTTPLNPHRCPATRIIGLGGDYAGPAACTRPFGHAGLHLDVFGYEWSEELELISSGLTPQQEVRSLALDAAAQMFIVDSANEVEVVLEVLAVARQFAAWIEHGDETA